MKHFLKCNSTSVATAAKAHMMMAWTQWHKCNASMATENGDASTPINCIVKVLLLVNAKMVTKNGGNMANCIVKMGQLMNASMDAICIGFKEHTIQMMLNVGLMPFCRAGELQHASPNKTLMISCAPFWGTKWTKVCNENSWLWCKKLHSAVREQCAQIGLRRAAL